MAPNDVRRVSVADCSFFFQAEDGIRDHCVTGVQTCALPISRPPAAVPAAEAAACRGPARPGPPQAGERPQCGIRIGMGNLAMGGAPLPQFANSLAMFVGRTVQDKTGLTGNYDVMLTWTPDQMPQRPPGAPEPPPADPNGPSIFTALQEQLGLKLDSQKGPVSVLVIDRVERPKEN